MYLLRFFTLKQILNIHQLVKMSEIFFFIILYSQNTKENVQLDKKLTLLKITFSWGGARMAA